MPKFVLFFFATMIVMPVFGDSTKILNANDVCSFYKDSSSCLNRAVDLVKAYSSVGSFKDQNKVCEISDGSRFEYKTSMNWMMERPQKSQTDWNFSYFDSKGDYVFSLTKTSPYSSTQYGYGFKISGMDTSGRSIDASFNSFNGIDSNLIHSVKCNLYDGNGSVENLITWSAFREAKKICPGIVGKFARTQPSISYSYSQILSKKKLKPYLRYLEEVIPFFTCEN